MLKIRGKQLEAFTPAAEAAFEGRVVEHLPEHHGAAVVRLPSGPAEVSRIPADVLRAMVRGGIAGARRYGIEWESNLTAFVVLMFVAAPNFDRHPLIAHVLGGDDSTPESKIDQLWEATTEENWEAVEQAYDPEAWNLASAGVKGE